ncbi:hypothetical protein K3495_g407 [Podosphaera aphanis]|nr:hypothetical protein K3495_g407 [Podosphaera aphanis]
MSSPDQPTTRHIGYGARRPPPGPGPHNRQELREPAVDEETRILGCESKKCTAGRYATLDAAVAAGPGTADVPTTGADATVQPDKVEPRPGRLSQVINKYRSVELANTGSVARDHLALERTFLAWLRTSLAFASIGVAITQLFRLNTGDATGPDSNLHLRQLGKPLGSTFISLSIIILLMGFYRYFECQQWIIQGKFPASRGSVIVIATTTFALMVASLVLVLVMGPGEEISI